MDPSFYTILAIIIYGVFIVMIINEDDNHGYR